MKLQRKDVIDEIAKRTGFYKIHTEKFIDALEDMLIDILGQATFDEDVEIQLTKGFTVGAERCHERKAKDPRNQNDIVVPEKNVPYAKFTHTFKQKINE